MDVYANEFSSLPPSALWHRENVLITPHVSGDVEAAVAAEHAQGMQVFVENLRAFVAGQPLRNVVDWERGY